MIMQKVKKLKSGFAISFALAFMLCFFAPYEIYYSNKHEFLFGEETMLPYGILVTLIVNTINLIVLVIAEGINRRIYNAVIIIEYIAFLSLYIQGNFLAYNLPGINGLTINWENYNADKLISIAVIVLVIIVTFAIFIIRGKDAFEILTYSSLFITGVLALTLIFEKINDFDKKNADWIPSKAGMFDMSTDDNLIIILLDFCSGEDFGEVVKNSPEYYSAFNDFTFYENTVGMYSYTYYSIPFILSGIRYEFQDEFDDYTIDAMNNAPLINKLKDEGYVLNLYESSNCLHYYDDGIYKFNNISKGQYFVSDSKKFIDAWRNLVGYRYAPWTFKMLFEVQLNAFSLSMGTRNEDVFRWDDLLFYEDCLNSNVSITSEKQFKFIHLEGAHTPYHIIKMKEAAGDYYDMVESCVMLVQRYVEMLRLADVYDNTAIVVMADHGNNANGTYGVNPLLMIKGRNEKHEYKISDIPVSYCDIQDAFIKLSDGAVDNEVFDNLEYGRTRYFLYQDSYIDTKLPLVEWSTDSYATNLEAFKPDGNVYSLISLSDGSYYFGDINSGPYDIKRHNGKYHIVNAETGEAISLYDSGTDRPRLVFDNEKEATEQEWVITRFDDKYRVSNNNWFLCFDHYNGTFCVRRGVTNIGKGNELWTITARENAINSLHGKYITNKESSIDNEFVGELHRAKTFKEYLDILAKNSEKANVFVAVSDIACRNLDEEAASYMEEIGLSKVPILIGFDYNSYLGCILEGKTVYEKIGGDSLITWNDLKGIEMSSATFRHGCSASITINGIDYAAGIRGFNIVIQSPETGMIMDSVVFDVFNDNNPAPQRFYQ